MTHDLRDQFDDLVADVAAYVVPDARAAWATGARRRTRHRVTILALVAAVLVLVAGIAAWMPRTQDPEPANPDRDGVGGYPARVVEPWRTRDLPDAPGPLAMIYAHSDGTWWVVDPKGSSWRIPQGDVIDEFPPAISPDGRMLGYLLGQSTYVVDDLVAGEDNGFSLDGGGEPGTADEPWQLAPQAPGFWSPDSQLLLLRATGTADTVVLDPDSTFRWTIRHRGFPAGWLDERTTAWLVPSASGPRVRLVGVSLRGRVTSGVELDLGRRPERWLSQWSGSVSPDGRVVSVIDGAGAMRVFRVADGIPVRARPTDQLGQCAVSWRGDQPVVFDGAGLSTPRGEHVVSFDGGEVSCAMTAADALAGEQHPGDSRWRAVLHWAGAHAAVVLFGGALALAGIVDLAVRRRRRRAPTT